MQQTDWTIFIAFLMSLALSILGLACLLCTEELQRYALRFNTRLKTPQNGRRLRVLGWIAISTGIPLTIVFAKKWYETWFI